ncbi:uncharacterized protein LOC121429408 [Lytechinus variegatus]|uniref:uncharacterized protein LOC121429408 n=1 Tax=Lytechinus variegatus TaxID=7654 RepID=UPI001BB2632B|nr:uncharacterized protein LOC121429408 [Lytechinus variegatus]
MPDAETPDTLESERKALIDEVKKKNNENIVADKMAKTFPLRRKEIVGDRPLVSTLKERWPGLFGESQIKAEFMRITTKPLSATFFRKFDNISHRLISICRSKGGALGKKLQEIMQPLEETGDINKRREVILTALCHYLGEDSSQLISEYLDTTLPEEILEREREKAMKIYVVKKEGGDVSDPPADIGIILEGVDVVSNIRSVADALILIFGLVYAVDLQYPPKLKYLFEVIQKLIMGLEGSGKLSPKVQSLKLKLMV